MKFVSLFQAFSLVVTLSTASANLYADDTLTAQEIPAENLELIGETVRYMRSLGLVSKPKTLNESNTSPDYELVIMAVPKKALGSEADGFRMSPTCQPGTKGCNKSQAERLQINRGSI